MQHRWNKAGLLKSALLGAATLGAISLASAGVARANVVNFSDIAGGSFTVTAYQGATVQHDATVPANSTTTGSANSAATFTYTGPINFDNTLSANTFADFGFSSSNISSFTGSTGSGSGSDNFSSLTNFLSGTMSTSSYGVTTYLTFAGIYSTNSGTTLQITHDDGAGFYVNGSTTAAFGSLVSPTVTVTNSGSIPGGTNNFVLAYVEANGAPAVLKALASNPNGTSVPEPGSLALLGTGLLGLGLVARRRRRKA